MEPKEPGGDKVRQVIENMDEGEGMKPELVR
jgi:hypothetical protein